MVTYRLYRLLAIFSFFIAQSAWPVAPKMQVWRKLSPDGITYHYVYCLEDIHHDYKDGKAGFWQRDSLIAIARVLESPFFIIEDPSSYDGPYKPFAKAARSLANYYGSIPHNDSFRDATALIEHPSLVASGLGSLCKKHGIGWYNPECRYFNSYDSYQEWPHLIEQMHNNLQVLTIHSQYSTIGRGLDALGVALNRIPSYDIAHLNMVGYHLLNVNILGSLIQQHPTHKNIFVCVGMKHIHSIEPDLPSLGYEHVISLGTHPDIKNIVAYALDIQDLFKRQIVPLDRTVLKP